jgi:hypothetical protein
LAPRRGPTALIYILPRKPSFSWNGGMYLRCSPPPGDTLPESPIPGQESGFHSNPPYSSFIKLFQGPEYPAFSRIDFRFPKEYNRTGVLILRHQAHRGVENLTNPIPRPRRQCEPGGRAGPSFVGGRESRINEDRTGVVRQHHKEDLPDVAETCPGHVTQTSEVLMPIPDPDSWRVRACGLLVALGLATADDLAASLGLPAEEIQETSETFISETQRQRGDRASPERASRRQARTAGQHHDGAR